MKDASHLESLQNKLVSHLKCQGVGFYIPKSRLKAEICKNSIDSLQYGLLK